MPHCHMVQVHFARMTYLNLTARCSVRLMTRRLMNELLGNHCQGLLRHYLSIAAGQTSSCMNQSGTETQPAAHMIYTLR